MIERATKLDIPRITEIERKCFQSPWSREAFEELLRRETYSIWVKRNEKNLLVAYVVLMEVADEQSILNIAVDPEHQRNGYARALIHHIHQHARDHGRKKSFLEVRELNKEARNLYESEGYKILTKRKEYYHRPKEDAIVMVKDL